MKIKHLIGFTSLTLLWGCGGSSSTPDIIEPDRAQVVPQLNQATTLRGPLTDVGASGFTTFLKNGIFSAADTRANPDNSSAPPPPATEFISQNFSVTNTQELGVDEADRMEYDGQTMFISAFPESNEDGEIIEEHIRVLRRQDDFSLVESEKLNVPDLNGSILGMYLASNRLAAISGTLPPLPVDFISSELAVNGADQRVALTLFDTDTASNVQQVTNIEFEGRLLASRRLDNEIYLVTSFAASIEGLDLSDRSEEARLANYNLVLDTPIRDIMPKRFVDGREELQNQPADCLIPNNATAVDGFERIITITRVNMEQPTDIESLCFSLKADTFYMSTNTIYLLSSLDNEIVINKFSLDSSINFEANGIIPGSIFGRGQSEFRLSEYQDILRVLTTDYTKLVPEHNLYVLEQQQANLNILAQLPNTDQPEAIGKPGEDVFAVRFFGERAYVVTFQQIDPLYVLDLSTPESPRIQGELEIPGFSDYLHPIDDQYILGVGQSVTQLPNPDTGIPGGPVVNDAMKIVLFDVSDPSQPIDVNTIEIPDAYTPVQYDHRALSVLPGNNVTRFALPYERWPEPESVGLFDWTPFNSLLLIEVDQSLGQMQQVDSLNIPSGQNVGSYNDRSVIQDNIVYYINGNQVWRGNWQEESDLFGPY